MQKLISKFVLKFVLKCLLKKKEIKKNQLQI